MYNSDRPWKKKLIIEAGEHAHFTDVSFTGRKTKTERRGPMSRDYYV